jgi:Short C-terminal domain
MAMYEASQPEYDEPASAPPMAPAAPQAPDYVAELERLGQLKAQGLLTDEEFEAKKKQILGL